MRVLGRIRVWTLMVSQIELLIWESDDEMSGCSFSRNPRTLAVELWALQSSVLL